MEPFQNTYFVFIVGNIISHTNAVKSNILFGRPYKEKRYLKTIEACEIQHDIEMFPDGNDTEVGERNISKCLFTFIKLCLFRFEVQSIFKVC